MWWMALIQKKKEMDDARNRAVQQGYARADAAQVKDAPDYAEQRKALLTPEDNSQEDLENWDKMRKRSSGMGQGY